MDRSTRSFTDPTAGLPHVERRRCIRQKLHTPVYASFNGPETGMVVDLSELLDLHEEGFAVQTSQRLEVNRAVTVCLDLTETQSYIHGTGHVVWSDDAGRGGIRFSSLPEKSRQVLKEWLFANLMIGCSHHASRSAQLAGREEEKSIATRDPSIVPLSPGSAMISAVEAVRLVVRDMGNDLDAILQLVTERALSFTGAGGAALAFLKDDKMICRARAGGTAPPFGAPVDVTHGLTGECIRSGVLVFCEDTQNDSRVDSEVCRTLGIGSLMAAPIVSDLQAIGLLEVFFSQPRNFTDAHRTVLERLVELIPTGHDRAQPGKTPPETPQGPEGRSAVLQPPASEVGPTENVSIHKTEEAYSESSEVSEQPPQPITEQGLSAEVFSAQATEPAPEGPARLLYRALIGLAVVAVFVVLGYLVAPVVDRRWAVSPQASQRSSSSSSPLSSSDAGSGQGAPDSNPPDKFLTELRKLAEDGNAEAQWQLGARYHNGEGVQHDDIQAMRWFRRAADQGNVTAQATLGAYYWAGRGVPQDLTEAYFWSALAFAQGDENSKSRIEGLATQMSREQVTSARQKADVWIRTHTRQTNAGTN
jgi:GAF domain/Sel1 repeat/PilZ domain